MRGAMLITFGALISRILGAIFRPAAQLFLGDPGLALVTPPSQAYQVILSISSVGLNVAISRLVSQRLALGDYRGARHIFRVSTATLVVSGLAFSLVFAVSAGWLARAMGFPETWIGFLVLSPAILLVTLECAFRGLYQGMQNMRPSAISQVVEQGGRVGAGLLLVAVLTPMALEYGAAGFNAGSTVGVLLGALYGAWIYFRDRPTTQWTTVAAGVVSAEKSSTGSLLRQIFAIAFPLSFLGAVLPLMGLIDSGIVTNRLISIGVDYRLAQTAIGWLANAATLRDLPSILTTALYVSLVPAVTESMAVQNLEQARYRASTALRVTFLIGLPATAGLLVGAQEAYGVLYAGGGFAVLQPLAWSTIFLMLQQTSSGVLQGMGLIWISVRNVFIGIALKTVLTFWWTGIPAFQASGAALATGIGFAAAAGLNLWSLRRGLGLTLQFVDDLLRPGAASVIMALAIWLISPVSAALFPGHRIPGAITVGAGGFIYLIAVFVVGGVKEPDLHLIPGFRPGWIRALRRWRLVRD